MSNNRAHSRTARFQSDLDTRDELTPLALAVKVIAERVYAHEVPRGRASDRATGIAHAVAALAPLYACALDGSTIRRLTDEELLHGLFRKDGAELHLRDGRPPITFIAVKESSVGEVIEVLRTGIEPHGNPAARSSSSGSSGNSASM